MQEVRGILNKHVTLSDIEWDNLSRCLRKEVLPKKTHLLEEFQVCDFVAFVTSGSLRYYHVKDGIEKVTGLFFMCGGHLCFYYYRAGHFP